MVAFQDGSIHDVHQVGDYHKTGICLRPIPQTVTEHDAIG